MKHRLFVPLLLGSVVMVAQLGAGQQRAPSQASARPSAAIAHYDDALLSKPTHPVKIENDVRVPMRDGVTLSVDIYRPDESGRFPAILIRTPYSNNSAGIVNEAKWFAERGYVSIQADVRGKFDSKGDFYPFRNELNDGFDTDDWIGKQPWFNGKLGTMGGSYRGFVQWGIAMSHPKNLTAMAPNVTTPDSYGNWIYTNGAMNYAFALSWGAVGIDGHTAQYTGAFDWPNVYRTLPLIDAPAAAGHRAPHFRDWAMHPTRDSYWDTESHENKYDQVSVPIFTVEGWYDIFLRGALQDDVAVRAKGQTEAARKGKHLMIGPWVHSTGRRNNTPLGQAAEPGTIDFGAAADIDLRRVYLRWHDYWLKGVKNGIMEEPPIKIFVMGENAWRFENEWPLARTQYTKYFISSGGRANTLLGDGVLSTAAPVAPSAASDTFTYDPKNPVPTTGGNICCASQVPDGPSDQRAIERRDDVLVFTSAPLAQAVEVTGPIAMKLYAATSARDTDWTVKLVDVAPDGYARNVQDGIQRARYRETGKPASLLESGRVYEYTVDMWATSNTFLPGHRIRLEISSSNFPRFDRNLNTGENTATGTRIEVAKQIIHHSPQYPSHVVLPIIPRGTTSTQ